jgi:hypothetical protein
MSEERLGMRNELGIRGDDPRPFCRGGDEIVGEEAGVGKDEDEGV